MFFLQQIYILVLNPIYKIVNRIDEKYRNIILFISILGMVIQFFTFPIWEKYGINFGYAQLFIINTCFLIITIFFSLNSSLQSIKWNRSIYVLWNVCAILIIISGIDHNVTGALMIFAALMLLVFPCLYFVWNNRNDYYVLYSITCHAIIVTLVVYFIFHLCMIPITSYLYKGITVNPNSNGFLGVAGVIASQYLMCLKDKKIGVYIIVMGMSVTLAYLSLSRASIIAIIFGTLVFLICYLKSIKERESNIIKSCMILFAIFAVSIISILGYSYILTNVTPHISNYIRNETLSEDYIESSRENPLIEKFNKGNSADTLTSGRFTIWKSYIKNLTLRGNERGDEGLYIKEQDRCVSAHNSYLEIAYRSGILAGLCYALIAIYAAVYAFRFIFDRKLFDYRLSLIPMAVMAFGVLSNLERALYPVEKAHIFLFFIALAPMFVKLERKSE